MKIVKTRTEKVRFGRMLRMGGNESEDLGEFTVAVHTVELISLCHVGFVSAEYKERTLDVVFIEDRVFATNITTGDKGKWISIVLPPDLSPPVPKPREWQVKVSKSLGEEYVWDLRCVGVTYGQEIITVREVLP